MLALLSLPGLAVAGPPALMAIPGGAGVGQSGQFSYTLPIAVPPGTAGIVPSLSLAYSSQASDGYEGLGWMLNGLPQITRCPRTQTYDSVHGGVNFDTNDRFCFNGQEMVVITGTYGADASVYRLLTDDFTQITYHATGTGTVADSFTVQLRTGVTLEMGATSSSKFKPLKADLSGVASSTSIWAVDKVSDPAGNYFTVAYTNDTTNGQLYPSEIDYTANDAASLSAYNSVQFTYMDRPNDAVPQYQAGTVTKVTKLLTHIKTYAGASVVTDYQLSYDYANSGAGHDEFRTFKQCDASGTCLAPTSFTWQGSRDAPALNAGIDVSAISQGSIVYPGDFLGSSSNIADGVTDVLKASTSCGTSAVWTGMSSGSSFSDSTMASYYQYYLSGSGSPYTWSGAMCFVNGLGFSGDFNGDGFSDVMLVEDHLLPDGEGGYIDNPYDNVLMNDKAGTLSQLSSSLGNDFAIFGDFNGDGRLDAFGFLSNGDATFTADSTHSGFTSGATQVVTGDFDGDGCTDLLAQGPSSASVGYFCNPATATATVASFGTALLIPGDFNGDGLTDILSVSGSTVKVYYATGTGFTAGATFTYSGTPSLSTWQNYKIVTGDFNGDGKTDLAFISHTSGTAHAIALSTGTGFTPLTTIANSDTTASAVVADWNSDGADDLWIQFSTSTHDTEYTFAFTPEVIISVDGGLGATTGVTYDRLNKNGTFYTKATTAAYPQRDLDGAYYVVKELDAPNGVGGSYVRTYAYAGAVADDTAPPVPGPRSNLATSGFTGFASMAVTDPQTSTVLTTAMATDPVYGGTASNMTLARGATVLESVSNIYTAVNTAGSSNVIELTQSVVTRNEVNGTAYPTVTTSYTYDAYANPLTITTQIGVSTYRTVTNSFNNDTTHWILGEVATTSDQRIVGSSNLTRHYGFGYGTSGSSLGKLTSTALEPATSALELDAAYGYDSFGNRSSVQLSGSGVTTRTPAAVTYDSVGRFPATFTDALSHGASGSYNADFGTASSITAIDATTTGATYDSFGRITGMTNPDGTKGSMAYAYCSGVNGGSMACPSHGAYAVTTTPLKTDGVTQNGAATIQYFDALGRAIAADAQGFDGSWIRQETQYDADFHVGQTSRPYFLLGGTPVWTTYSYIDSTSAVDPFGRVWSVTVPKTGGGSYITTYVYNALATTVTDPNSHATTTTLNAQGLVASVLDAASHTTSYVYDAFNNLTSATDPAGNTTSASFDLRGRRTGISDPDRGSWSFSYDVLSELTSQTDAKSQTTTFTYDLMQRPFRRTEPDLSSIWQYDSGGYMGNYGYGKPYRDCNASTCSSSTYQRTVLYQSDGKPFKIQLKVDGTTYNYIATYDSASGRMSTLTYPSGFVAKYEYNGYGYLADIKDNSSGALIWTANTRNAELQLTQATSGNGVVANASFDANDGHVVNICATNHTGTCDGDIANQSYSWDGVGNLTERDDVLNSADEILTYDNLDRQVTGAINGGSTRSLAYDASGNIIKKSTVCTVLNCMTYGSGAGPHALTGVTGTYNGVVNPTFTYDANGNMTGGAGKTFTWTSYNMVSSIVQGATTLGFTYKPDHQRLKLCVGAACSGSPSSVTLYLNDPITGAGSELTTAGSTTTWNDYITADGGIVAERTNSMSVITMRYFTLDHMGSTVALTNSTGGVIESNSYDPYGKRRTLGGGTDTACALTSATTRGFSGHEMMDSVCLTNMNARVYDQTLGRFIGADNVAFAPGDGQDLNTYAYVRGRNATFRDPTGHFKIISASGGAAGTPDVTDNDIQGGDSGHVDPEMPDCPGDSCTGQGQDEVVHICYYCGQTPSAGVIMGTSSGNGPGVGGQQPGGNKRGHGNDDKNKGKAPSCPSAISIKGAKDAIATGQGMIMMGTLWDAAGVGADALGGGPEDPVGDAVAYWAMRRGGTLIYGGIAVSGGGIAFLADNGMPREAINATVETGLDLVDKSVVPEKLAPVVDEGIDWALNKGEDAFGLAKDRCH